MDCRAHILSRKICLFFYWFLIRNYLILTARPEGLSISFWWLQDGHQSSQQCDWVGYVKRDRYDWQLERPARPPTDSVWIHHRSLCWIECCYISRPFQYQVLDQKLSSLVATQIPYFLSLRYSLYVLCRLFLNKCETGQPLHSTRLKSRHTSFPPYDKYELHAW